MKHLMQVADSGKQCGLHIQQREGEKRIESGRKIQLLHGVHQHIIEVMIIEHPFWSWWMEE